MTPEQIERFEKEFDRLWTITYGGDKSDPKLSSKYFYLQASSYRIELEKDIDRLETELQSAYKTVGMI